MWMSIGYFFTKYRVGQLTTEKYTEITKNMHKEIRTLVKEKAETVLIIAMSISNNNQIKEAILKKQKMKLDLNAFSLSLQENTSLSDIWIQVVNKDGTSLYRSWTKKNGDDLKKFRIDVTQMIQNPTIRSTISVGKFDLTFKSMVPLYESGKFIGFVEVIAKFNSIATKMSNKDYDSILLVDKKYKRQLTKAFTKTFIEDYYVATLNAKPELVEYIEKKGVKAFININTYLVDNNFSKLISMYPVMDINGEKMGYFTMFYDLNNTEMQSVNKDEFRLFLLFIASFMISLALFYYFYLKNYETFINKLNDELENMVVDKTKEIQSQNDELEYVASHDPLTKLPNRMLFIDRLKQSIKSAERTGGCLCVLFLDLDRFKEVNDTYGHDIGDKLLQAVATRLRTQVREVDTISRLGGDEFTISLVDSSSKQTMLVVDKIVSLMAKVFLINEIEIYTTFSIGISKFPEDGETYDILLRNADTAMYRAKERGKNTYQFYNFKMTELIVEKSKLALEIKRALENDEFIPYYQPKVNANTSKIIGMEALIRWEHPEYGFITPDKFIPVAEEIGLINKIDLWMMKKTISDMSKLQKNGFEIGVLSLNFSMQLLEDLNCFENLQLLLKKFQVNPKDIEVEIPETVLIGNQEKVISVLNKFRELKIVISIDDFGTGYSSLSYLKLLPIDKLKIDRSFVDDLPDDKNDVAIIKAIIALAQSLKMDLIAEGIETKEQADFLVKAGCPNHQGYYYSKPIPFDKLESFLKQSI
jgi:diguanylate cyclase (GGDEF)-like protein